jgi:hypothetical protein
VAQTPEAVKFKSYSFKLVGVVSFCLGANLNKATLTFRSPSGREIRHGDQILRMEVSFSVGRQMLKEKMMQKANGGRLWCL